MRATAEAYICAHCSRVFLSDKPRSERREGFCCSRVCRGARLAQPEMVLARLMAKLDRHGSASHQPQLGSCWLFTGSTNRKGYGQFVMPTPPRINLAHRASWMLHNGPIPDGMFVLHKCDQPACCRPDHLFLGTNADNVEDMMKKGRYGANRPHKRGDEHWTHRRPDLVRRGKDIAGAVITEDDVRTIREMAQNGVRQNFIAAKLGVSKAIVSRVVQGTSWSHVPAHPP